MINLAKRSDADEHIRRELERCRIEIEEVEPDEGEVPYSLIGHIGPVEFRRSWYYWAANGPVSLETAEELYADPVGKTDIRVNGDAGAPAPLDEAVWMTDDGKIVLPTSKEASWRQMTEQYEFLRAEFEKYVFSDDPTSLGASQFIMSYHIDSEVGLRLFADALRAKAAVAP